MPESSNAKKLLGEALQDMLSTLKTGSSRQRVRVGLMAFGNELGQEELLEGARLAAASDAHLQVVPIGPVHPSYRDLEWLETAACESEIAAVMEKSLADGTLSAAVALHYPFPMGVTTIGRAVTPSRGRSMFIASTTGASAAHRTEAMVRNALYGVAAARACGISNPSVGVMNVDGAQTVVRLLDRLREQGYPLIWGASQRSDGGAILRGNDALMGSVDVCVTDTLTGNIMMKFFSAWNSGGSYEASGWGYGPSIGAGWKRIVSIISRASGAPVIAGALTYTAQVVRGELVSCCETELRAAKEAGLETLLETLRPAKTTESAQAPTPPPAEPTDEEVHGIDVLSIEEAARALWSRGIYAQSAMGCTGPVVKVPGHRLKEAEEVLRQGGFIE